MVSPGDLINKIGLIPQIPSLADLTLPTLPEVGDLFNIIQGNIGVPGLGLFQNPIAGDINLCAIATQFLIDNGDFTGQPALLTTVGDASSALSAYSAHTDSLVSGLPDNIGPVISCLRVTQSVGSGLDPSNPCNALNNIFGSILGEGAQLIDALTQALAAVILPIVGPAIGIIAGIASVVADILGRIASEVAALAAVLTELTSFASSSGLTNLSLDPCAQALYNSAGTPALLGSLPNLPNF